MLHALQIWQICKSRQVERKLVLFLNDLFLIATEICFGLFSAKEGEGGGGRLDGTGKCLGALVIRNGQTWKKPSSTHSTDSTGWCFGITTPCHLSAFTVTGEFATPSPTWLCFSTFSRIAIGFGKLCPLTHTRVDVIGSGFVLQLSLTTCFCFKKTKAVWWLESSFGWFTWLLIKITLSPASMEVENHPKNERTEILLEGTNVPLWWLWEEWVIKPNLWTYPDITRLSVRLGYLAGVVPKVDEARFARALWRAARGNTFASLGDNVERGAGWDVDDRMNDWIRGWCKGYFRSLLFNLYILL